MNRIGLVSTLVLAFVAVFGPDVASAQTVIRGGEVRPVGGEPIEEGVVVIGADGTIESVGDSEMSVPSGAEVVDASGMVVTPGLVDARTQLGLVEIWAVDETRDYDRGGDDRIRASFRAADGFNPTSAALPVTRTGGVTSAVIVPNGGLVAGQSAWIDLRGSDLGFASVVEPTVGMHMRFRAMGGEEGLKSRGAISESLRELYDDARYFRDNAEAFDENRARDLAASRLDLEALTETLGAGRPVVFNSHRASDILQSLEFAEEEGLDPIVTGGLEAWRVADRLASEQIPVVVQPTANLPSSFETLGARFDNAARLAEAGVPVVLSTFDTHNVRKLRQFAGNAIRAGMSREQALRAVTLHPAEAFRVDDRYGTLESGKVGNVVVWSGDPFELSTRVEAMFVRGRRVSLETRQEKLFERYRDLDRTPRR